MLNLKHVHGIVGREAKSGRSNTSGDNAGEEPLSMNGWLTRRVGKWSIATKSFSVLPWVGQGNTWDRKMHVQHQMTGVSVECGVWVLVNGWLDESADITFISHPSSTSRPFTVILGHLKGLYLTVISSVEIRLHHSEVTACIRICTVKIPPRMWSP
jgi:hypothetical protein